MKAALRALISGWFLLLLAVLVLSVLIWIYGPRLAFDDARPLASDTARLAVIVVLLVLWGLFARSDARAAPTDANTDAPPAAGTKPSAATGTAASATATAPAPAALSAAEERNLSNELDILRDRLAQAQRRTRRAVAAAGWGGGWRYRLPWYLVLGPQEAGKSRLLARSGLPFPLAEPGSLPVESETIWAERVGLWLSDEAVFVEPPGELIDEIGPQGIARPFWQGLLEGIGRIRPRQPLNGIVLTFPLPDLLQRDEAQLQDTATHLRERLAEIRQTTGQRLPVYLVLTQADRLAGFEEFFDGLSAEQRRQVLGFTLPALDDSSTAPAFAALEPEYEALIERLNRFVPERLHQEPDILRRGLAYAFPQQLALARGPLRRFLEVLFRPNRYEDRPVFRGLYFTSAEQAGEGVDLLRGSMAGLVPEEAITRPGGWSPGTGRRDYFLHDLLGSVIMGDARAVSLDPGYERRRRNRLAGVSLAVALLVGLLTLGWYLNLSDTYRLLDRHTRAMAWTSQLTGALMQPAAEENRIDAPDFQAVTRPLDVLRANRDEITAQVTHRPWRALLGFYRGRAIAVAAQDAYDDALQAQFRPRLLLHLEQQLVQPDLPLDQLYTLLRAYLVLGGEGPSMRGAVTETFGREWAEAFPAPAQSLLRDSLRGHLQRLTDLPVAGVDADAGAGAGVDARIVEHARARLNEDGRGERGMDLLRGLDAVARLPRLRLADIGGPLTGRTLVRRSGRSLQEGVPGVFTAQGFLSEGKPAAGTVAGMMAAEGWVMGAPRDAETVAAETAEIRTEILQVYAERYARTWETLMADLAIVPLRGPEQAADVLSILGGPASPLRRIYLAAAAETDLMAAADAAEAEAEAEEGAAALTAARDAADAAAARAASARGALARTGFDVARGFGLSGLPEDRLVEALVTDRFAPLRETVGESGEGAQITALLARLNEAGQAFTRLVHAPNPELAVLELLDGRATDGVPLPAALSGAALSLPGPLADTLTDLADEVRSVGVRGAQGAIAAQWAAEVVPVCTAITFRRFPIDPQAEQQVTTEDFVALYGPDGLLAEFFTDRLAALVDTSARPWRWHPTRAGDLGFADDTPQFFQRVDAMRRAFFPDGAAEPTLRFQLRPRTLDAAADRLNLQIGESRLAYAHGPREATSFEWVAADDGMVRLFLTPPLPGQRDGITATGPWSLLRFLAEGAVLPTDLADQFLLRLQVGNRSVAFELQSSSIGNPFGTNLLAGLVCPEQL